MIDALAALYAIYDDEFFVLHILGDQNGNVPADSFLSGKAKYSLSPFVPTGNNAIESFADDGVIGRFNDGGKPTGRNIVSAQFIEPAADSFFRKRNVDIFRHIDEIRLTFQRQVQTGENSIAVLTAVTLVF
jgi:hypothetical protein